MYQRMYVEELVFVIPSAPQTASPTFPHEGHFSKCLEMTGKWNDGVYDCGQIGTDADAIISYFRITFHPIDLRFTLLSCI